MGTPAPAAGLDASHERLGSVILDFATLFFPLSPNPFLIPRGSVCGLTVQEGDPLVTSVTFGGFCAQAVQTTDARSQAPSAGMELGTGRREPLL